MHILVYFVYHGTLTFIIELNISHKEYLKEMPYFDEKEFYLN
jgi:hypothetical protein